MTDSDLIGLTDVTVIALSVLTAPFMLRSGRRWCAATEAVTAVLFAIMLWGRSGERWNTAILIVLCVLMIALLALTVMSLSELRREMHEAR
jgi:hypothetical protein